jgi:hypothetical protein
MEGLSSSETSVLTRSTLRNIPEDAIFHSHRHENLKSYMRQNILIAMQFASADHIVLSTAVAVKVSFGFFGLE